MSFLGNEDDCVWRHAGYVLTFNSGIAMSPELLAQIESGLFPSARSIMSERPDFPWHLDKSRIPTATLVASSQAIAIDFFQTIKGLSSQDVIMAAWTEHLGIPFHGPWRIELEHVLSKSLLNEPRSTQLDALALSDDGVITFECKFTEPDGGGCSQPNPLQSGAHKGMAQCNGSYTPQVNPVNGISSRCALTGKGIKYWSHVPSVLDINADADIDPCPFRGGWYQWMRNLLAAQALGRERGVKSAALVVYVDGDFPMAKKVRTEDWKLLQEKVAGRAVPLRAVSYQELLKVAIDAAPATDR